MGTPDLPTETPSGAELYKQYAQDAAAAGRATAPPGVEEHAAPAPEEGPSGAELYKLYAKEAAAAGRAIAPPEMEERAVPIMRSGRAARVPALNQMSATLLDRCGDVHRGPRGAGT